MWEAQEQLLLIILTWGANKRDWVESRLDSPIQRRDVWEYCKSKDLEGLWHTSQDSTKTRLQLENYRKWKQDLEYESYLDHELSQGRVELIRLRTGSSNLRLETGRWETIRLGGKSLNLDRELRLCKLCFKEVEDECHLICRCPAFKQERDSILGNTFKAYDDNELALSHLITGKGQENLIRYLSKVMPLRQKLLSYG